MFSFFKKRRSTSEQQNSAMPQQQQQQPQPVRQQQRNSSYVNASFSFLGADRGDSAPEVYNDDEEPREPSGNNNNNNNNSNSNNSNSNNDSDLRGGGDDWERVGSDASGDALPAVSVSLTAEHAVIPRGTAVDEMWCVATVTANAAATEEDAEAADANAPGQDLVLVLDRSGSMGGDKIELLKLAVRFVISEMRPVDRLSLVTFSSSSTRETPLLRCDEAGKARSLAAIDAVRAGGGTNITNGANTGLSVLESRVHGRSRPCNLFLLTDGLGPLDVDGLTPRFLSLECPVFSFGLGADHDADALDKLATATGGVHAYIENDEQLAQVFGVALGGIGSKGGALAVRLFIDCPGGAGSGIELGQVHAGVFGQVGDESGAAAKFATLFAGETKSIPFATKVSATSGEVSTVQARITWSERTADGRVDGPGASTTLEIARPPGDRPVDSREADPVITMQRLRVMTVNVNAEISRSGRSGPEAETRIKEAIAKIEAVTNAFTAEGGSVPDSLALASCLVDDLKELLNMVRQRDTSKVQAYSKTSWTRHEQQRSNTASSVAYATPGMAMKKSKAKSFV